MNLIHDEYSDRELTAVLFDFPALRSYNLTDLMKPGGIKVGRDRENNEVTLGISSEGKINKSYIDKLRTTSRIHARIFKRQKAYYIQNVSKSKISIDPDDVFKQRVIETGQETRLKHGQRIFFNKYGPVIFQRE